MVLLPPFKQLRLEIDFGIGDTAYVDVRRYYSLLDESLATFISLVEIYGTHQCFEGVPIDVGIVGVARHDGMHYFVEPHFPGNFR